MSFILKLEEFFTQTDELMAHHTVLLTGDEINKLIIRYQFEILTALT